MIIFTKIFSKLNDLNVLLMFNSLSKVRSRVVKHRLREDGAALLSITFRRIKACPKALRVMMIGLGKC